MSANHPYHVPYSDEIDKLVAKKTSVLWRARRKMDEGLIAEAKVLYEETAQYEEQLARLLENEALGGLMENPVPIVV